MVYKEKEDWVSPSGDFYFHIYSKYRSGNKIKYTIVDMYGEWVYGLTHKQLEETLKGYKKFMEE